MAGADVTRMRLLVAAAMLSMTLVGGSASSAGGAASPGTAVTPTTPIQHLVVIYNENVSFDHYFGTYPTAANPPGEPAFQARAGTPAVDGLTPALRTSNPNLANPFRLDRSQAVTCDQLHEYRLEQQAMDGGKMDQFVEFTGTKDPRCSSTQVMGYYDGNTVTAMWNYAQHFALADEFFGTTFGPSTPGALNLVSGQTAGASPIAIPDEVTSGTVIGDPDPAFDECGSQPTASLSGLNVGDMLSERGVSWGWFQGGFRPSSTSGGKAVCGTAHANIAGASSADYVAHHEPFQYYQTTASPHHLPPTSTAMIGHDDQAHHQYDLASFWTAVGAGNMPAVSFLKPPAYQDGHAGYSDPLDEQRFLVATLNRLQQTPEWSSTAVIIAYDDSDGWYDHRFPPIVNNSADPAYDALYGAGLCGSQNTNGIPGRCGHGPRLPMLVVSPYARVNAVNSTTLDQASILRFIEDNWSLGRIGNASFDARAGNLKGLFAFSRATPAAKLLLDPATGQPR